MGFLKVTEVQNLANSRAKSEENLDVIVSTAR